MVQALQSDLSDTDERVLRCPQERDLKASGLRELGRGHPEQEADQQQEGEGEGDADES